MAEFNLQLEIDLTPAEAQRDILKNPLRGELSAFVYDRATGIAKVTTRALPPFPVVDPESDESKLLNDALDSVQAIRAANDRDRIALDKRQANILRGERKLEKDRLDFDTNLNQLVRQREKFEKDLNKAARMGLGTKIKSFFHNIK